MPPSILNDCRIFLLLCTITEEKKYQISLECVYTADCEPDMSSFVTREGAAVAKFNLHPFMIDYSQPRKK